MSITLASAACWTAEPIISMVLGLEEGPETTGASRPNWSDSKAARGRDFAADPDLEDAVQDRGYRCFLVGLTEEELPGLQVADSGAMAALHHLLGEGAFECGFGRRDDGSLVLTAPGRRLRALPVPPVVILTSSTDRAQFGAQVNGYWFVAKADISATAIASFAGNPAWADRTPASPDAATAPNFPPVESVSAAKTGRRIPAHRPTAQARWAAIPVPAAAPLGAHVTASSSQP